MTASMNNSPNPLKFVLVGDSQVGKTTLMTFYNSGMRPTEEELVSLDIAAKEVVVDSVTYFITLVDTIGATGSAHDRTRPNSYYYPNADVFIMCYAIDDRVSFANVMTRWIPEVTKHCPTAGILLVGTKMDLRTKLGSDSISESDGLELRHKSRALGIIECSSKTGQNVIDVFSAAVRIGRRKYKL